MEDPGSSPAARRTRLTLGIVGCLTLLSIGWTGLLIPSLIRSIESTFDQTDAGIGVIYLVYAVTYMSGSFGGGSLTERFGRRLVLGGAVLVHAVGIAGLGLAPSWAVFVVAALVAGSGAGALDGGANGLVLDVYPRGPRPRHEPPPRVVQPRGPRGAAGRGLARRGGPAVAVHRRRDRRGHLAPGHRVRA